MIKRMALAALTSTLLVSASLAQATPPVQPATPPAETTPAAAPQNPDECLAAASDLAQSAEEQKLAEDKLDKIEDLLSRMETHCDARQFVEAMAVAKDIKVMIETR